jgi:tetratricopeptide (TPR) repeat protein
MAKDGLASGEAAQRLARKQERLIEAQTAQLGRARWRDFIVAAAGAAALVATGLFVWDCSRADGVVVEPFAVPPDMAQQGLSGPVLAAQLLDKLTGMQARTESLRAHSSYANDWSNNIEIEIPKTGVSISELRGFLRQWLGHQTRLSGEVYHLPDGRIAVTTRVGADPGTRSEGQPADLDALLQRGAEGIYAETQPYRYAVWLTRQERFDEAKTIRLKLVAGKDLNDKLWGYNGLAAAGEDPAERDRLYASALRLRSDFAPAISNRALGWASYGQDENAYHGYDELLRHAAAARRELEPGWAEFILSDAASSRALLVGDLREAADQAEKRIGLPASQANVALAPLTAAQQAALGHDLPRARRILSENGLAAPKAMAERLEEMGPDSEVESGMAAAIGDWRAAAARLETVLAAIAGYKLSAQQMDPTIQTRASLALALARSGQIARARTVIGPTALDCAYCVRARGIVAAYAGDPAAADRWLAMAVRLAPSLPAAHNDWAEAYLVRRDPTRAIAQARIAVALGPNWAEPRKAWGDALMMQGKPAEAARRYREALRLAPDWGALHLARGQALAAAGKTDAAQASFRAAQGLDLNAADWASVRRRLAEGPGPRGSEPVQGPSPDAVVIPDKREARRSGTDPNR